MTKTVFLVTIKVVSNKGWSELPTGVIDNFKCIFEKVSRHFFSWDRPYFDRSKDQKSSVTPHLRGIPQTDDSEKE